MQNRCVGNTDIYVSPLGLGTVKFGRNQGVKYPQAFNLPTDSEILELLNVAKDLGINLIDTAPAYGTSEARLGAILSDRKNWIISTKVGEEFVDGESSFDFSRASVIKSIERSLKNLRTDYLDIVLVHSNGEDEKIISQDNIFTVLKNLKAQGKIRAFGMSTKTIAGGIQTIDQADLAMVTYNVNEYKDRAIIQFAQQLNKGIFIKKAFASGFLTADNNSHANHNPIQAAMDFVFAEPGVTSLILGTINPNHLRENVAAALQSFSS